MDVIRNNFGKMKYSFEEFDVNKFTDLNYSHTYFNPLIKVTLYLQKNASLFLEATRCNDYLLVAK